MDKNLPKLIFNAVALGVGVSTLVLKIVGKIQMESAITLLSFGVICLAIAQLKDK